MDDIKFDWNDVSIVPAPESKISSRSEVSPYYSNNKLPLFVSPMDTVVDLSNYEKFLEQGFEVCMPRGEYIQNDEVFISYGIKEFEELLNKEESEVPKKVLIDVANGHMTRVMEASKEFKSKFPNNQLMVGNIANPKTFELYCHIGVDYVRVGIGGGCFVPESLVKTKKGLIRIDEIEINDEVLTHKNRYRKVLQKHSYSRDESLIKINDSIISTKNHEFYVIDKDDKEMVTEENLHQYAYWLIASKLDKNKHLLIEL